MEFFEPLKQKEIFKEMMEYHGKVAPLQTIGKFLNEVGSMFANDNKIFYPGHKVLSISFLENGNIVTRA